MKLQEYRSKEILARHGVPLVAGETATTPEEARAAAERIGGPVVVKAQVLVGGRGKAGGVKLASTPDEAAERAREIIGLDIKGTTVKTVLVAPAADIAHEYYLGLILDRGVAGDRRHRVAPRAASRSRRRRRRTPRRSCACPLHPLIGLQEHQVRRVGFFLGIPAELRKRLRERHARPLRRLRRVRRRPRRDQPAGGDRRRPPRGARRQDRARRLGAASPSRPRGDARPQRGGAVRDRGARGRHQLHQARRQHRLHGQRRRPGDDHHGPRQARRRRAGQLPRHRRRREGRSGGRGLQDHPRRSERAGHPDQHLRRHHPRRRGGPRHRRGAGAADARRADGGPHRRHERRGGAADPAPRPT